MPDQSTLQWNKETSPPKTYSFQFSPKLKGILKRRGYWSPDGSAEMGSRKLRFASNGKANMDLTVYDAEKEAVLATLEFRWKDFQRSSLKFKDGNTFTFKAFDLVRGVWSWVREGGVNEQFIFRVDSPMQRSGSIENQSRDLSTLERDILLLLGLHLQHYINTWLLTLLLVIILVVSG